MKRSTPYPRVYLKRRKYRLFLQTQRDFALKSLGIHKGFQGSLPYILLVFAKYPSFSLFSDTPYDLGQVDEQIDLLLMIQLVIKFLTQIGIDAL